MSDGRIVVKNIKFIGGWECRITMIDNQYFAEFAYPDKGFVEEKEIFGTGFSIEEAIESLGINVSYHLNRKVCLKCYEELGIAYCNGQPCIQESEGLEDV